MATIATQLVTHAGIAGSFAAASAGGDACATGAGMVLVVKNGDSVSHTVTLATPGTVDGLAISDRTVTVAAGDEEYIGVPDLFKDPATGLATVTYDAVTSVTVAVFRVP